jgi:hypothetical protein
MDNDTQTRVRILVDRDAESPRENDNVGTMACWHRRYRLGDVQPTETPEDYIAALPADSLILPLYLYDHSGITMRASAFSCPWDSGQVGIIHVSPERIAAEFGTDEHAREQAERCLLAEVDVYDEFIQGNVFGFVIEEGETCDHGAIHWEQTDSCWGFIGADPFKNGMSEHVPSELHDKLREAAQTPEYR